MLDESKRSAALRNQPTSNQSYVLVPSFASTLPATASHMYAERKGRGAGGRVGEEAATEGERAESVSHGHHLQP